MYSFLGHKKLLIKAETPIPWDVSSLINEEGDNIDADLELYISNDGTSVYAYDDSTLLISQYPLSTPFDNTSIGSLISSFDASGQLGRPSDIRFNFDGTKMYLVSAAETTSTIYIYTLSTAWLISTASYSSSKTITDITWLSQISFVGNGYIMYAIGNSIDTYDLTTPFDISTAVKSSQTLASSPASRFTFRNDGKYAIGLFGSVIAKSFELTTPYDISTLTEFASFDLISTYERYCNGLFVDRFGRYVFNTGTNYDVFFRMELETISPLPQIGPWDASSYIINGLYDVGSKTKPCVVKIDSSYYLLSSEDGNTTLNCWIWNGSSWVTDTSILSGLSVVNNDAIQAVYIGSSIYLVFYTYTGSSFRGFLWNGSSWVSNSEIVSGLSTSSNPSMTTFYIGTDLYCVIATYSQGWLGYIWNGSGWTSDSDIIIGLDDSQYDYRTKTFYLQDELYLLVIWGSTYSDGYKWTGTQWESFPMITGGFDGDFGGGHDEFCTFYFEHELYLMSGNYGNFLGYKY